MKKGYLYGLATGLASLAALIVTPASVLFIYQGDTPKELLKK
ncbi:cyclic lactone autoinducer peptide [Paenibacillus sp. FSL K6-1318]